ncbi:MAG: hypothetical protein EOO75_07795 [Myxococcales bacterium]|nr:MAG: hypothetical protein EOO75_07795 [Myxococcales bacterium]
MRAEITAVALLLAAACGDEDERNPNGSACLKNRDCASDRCVAALCQARPAFQAGGGASATDE